MKYNELVAKAMNGELVADNINEIVLTFADENQKREKYEKEQNQKNSKFDRKFRDIDEEYPLLPPEADDLSNAVKRKGVEVLGGKGSNAYANKELRTKVYRDIYYEVKREFGLINEHGVQMSYKKLKRKYLDKSFNVISAYVCPAVLEEEIISLNDLGDID